MTGTARADGSFALDLGPVLAADGAPGVLDAWLATSSVPALDVWARHPRYLSEHTVVQAAPAETSGDGLERHEYACELRLRLASVVTGRVRVPAGWRVEDAEVSLGGDDLAHADGELLGLERATCDAEGRYAIKSLREGRLDVRADLAGLLPAGAPIALERGATLELPDLVLEAGRAAIRGRVDLVPSLIAPRGADASGAGGMRLDARLGELRVLAWRVRGADEPTAAPAPVATVLDRSSVRGLRELRGGARLATQSCAVQRDGSFELRGLEPGSWRLEVHGLRVDTVLRDCEWPTVVAPAQGVVLGEHLGTLTFQVRDSRGPVAGALLTLGGGGSFSSLPTGADGVVRVAADLRHDYRGNASCEGRESVPFELPALGRAREATLELRLADAAPPARIVLRAPPSGAPEHVHLQLDSLDDPPLQAREEPLSLRDGAYAAANVPPGRWQLTVRPAEEHIPVAFHGATWLTERFEATLVSDGTFEAQLTCAPGGRLQLALHADPSLQSSAVACELVRLDGRPVPPPIFVSALAGEGFGVFSASAHLRLLGEDLRVGLRDCLAPGTYELRLAAPLARATPVRFEIEAGQTAQAEWRLEPLER
ncbi:MAG: carboxypeptidase regulatory-like domain-containing protein [Planctomycetes bacterium]|nr:carboxypeptidase regulatory-like domain-containing protein [Planctomycetota bacterium]